MSLNQLINKSIITIDDFLKIYDTDIDSNFQDTLNPDFQLNISYKSQKKCPIVRIAKQEDAKEITQIFKDLYKGTYPYKQMEDVQEVLKMINDSNYHWFLFKLNINETIGCFGTHIELDKKKGILFGFVIKKKYQSIVDSLKAFVCSLLFLWKKYKNKILVWSGEVRTNDAAPQFGTSFCGIKPVAFYPNKDMFLNHIESNFLHIIYDDKALRKHRYRETPKIIRQVLNCYTYSNNRYHLGSPEIKNPKISIDSNKFVNIRRKIVKRTETDRYGNKLITLSIKNSDSFFMFLYNPNNQLVEKTIYEVTDPEELIIYLQEVKKIIKDLKIHYFECFVSAYEPWQQKIFLNAGLKPRGYVFSWEYNKEHNVFEDRVVFNYYEGDIDKNIKLIPETFELLRVLKFFENKLIPELTKLPYT